MKREFSTAWLASSQVRKQRKYRYNAPLHTKHKFLSAHLSKDLKSKYGKRSVPVRKGDEVLVMRGSFKKKKGKVSEINLKRSRVAIEGLQRQKKDGTKVNVYFNPSKILIQTMNIDDKERIAALGRKASERKGETKNAPNKI